jgi:trk system potassium uptake protein TrkA
MRAVFVGGNKFSVMTSQLLLHRGHEVVIIDRDKGRIEELAADIDCGFLHGDGSTPAVLTEADPAATDTLFCLTGNDQTNIIASLVGRSLGFKHVVTRIDNPEFEHICIELGLENVIVPSGAIGRYLADIFAGRNPLEVSAVLRDEARVFTFIAKEKDEMAISDLGLPEQARIICIYRHNRFLLPEEDMKLKAKDEVVILAHSKHLEALEQEWG